MAKEVKLWIWVRVPLRALYAAIDALKERSAARHLRAGVTHEKEVQAKVRADADADDQHAEDLKSGLRNYDKGEEPPRD